jgi:hypothetical protein
MAKCVTCGERKGNRFCQAVNSNICSLCCGSKRQKEIQCAPSCDYLKKGAEYQLDRDITRRVSSDLHAESEDMFQMKEVIPFVMSLERFFVDEFYRDRGVNDDHIHECLRKIYAFQTGKFPALEASNRVEELIFLKFREVDRKTRDLEESLKARAVLRIIRSIRSSSGGVLGNRNYLEMIYSQHTGKGKWVDLFRELERKE